jgi:malic enzyme
MTLLLISESGDSGGLRSVTSLRYRFVQLVRKYHPHSLLHFEDFGTANAYRLLEKYRNKHAVFNDDM